MSDKNIKIGDRVEIIGRDLVGTVAYAGMTNFAVGKWVGVVLDEPKGKNNGTIKGQTYFDCKDNYGMFVRPTQLKICNEGLDTTSLGSSTVINKVVPKHTIPQPTKTRLSGSKPSLSSSRQSLGGSRPQLSSSLTERSNSTSSVNNRKSLQSPQVSTSLSKSVLSGSNTSLTSDAICSNVTSCGGTTPKGASFVETGFVEILKPQFTSLHPMRSSSFCTSPSSAPIEEKGTRAEQKKLTEELQNQVLDLTEKLETLKQRRSEDKERLREFDKMKIQFEQLQEFRSKIIAAQASLQKELLRAKQEAKEAIEAKELHAQEMADLADNVELITLDKEMAEEKVDTLQLELDSARERIEELQVDLELLRSEMQNRGNDPNNPAISNNCDRISSYEFKQLEQQNARLKETLVRLRDLSAHDKHDIQKLSKELEMKRSEVTELECTKEKLASKIDELEAIVADLQEQVDTALGAEEMVEQLAEKKMELEDKVKLLEEEVAQLEALEEVHEQLVESNHDLEMDLREELDMAYASKKEVLRERDAAIETIYDRDQTIVKFRELVHKLNEQLSELRDKANSTTNELQDTSLKLSSDPIIDYKHMFAESKAYTRAIDVQLRQIELAQVNEQVQILTAFMPDSFMCRGGDYDAILVILLISRLVLKCDIIINQTRERFPAADHVSRESIFQDHKLQQYAFKCRLMHYIHNLQGALHQILYGLNRCSPDTLLRAGSSLPEMVGQEKNIDSIIELYKLNQIDEYTCTDNIEKCVLFFNAMNSVLLSGENLLNEIQTIRDSTSALSAACDSILIDANIVMVLFRNDNVNRNSGDVVVLMQYLVDNMEIIKQQVKLIRRRIPQESHINKCGLSAEKLQTLRYLTLALTRIMLVLHMATKQALPASVCHIEEDAVTENALEPLKYWELLCQACESVYEQDDRGPSSNFKSILNQANQVLPQIAQYLLDKEYEIISNAQQKQEKTLSPIMQRAQMIKKQLEQKNVLAATLENREADIKQLKMAAKLKQNELSEMQIRKDLAEKKLSVLQSEFDHTVDKLKRSYEEVCQKLEQKEREFEKTMDHLQNDIDALENERLALREKLKLSTGKRFETNYIKSSGTVNPSGGTPYAPATCGSISLLDEELHLLKQVFNAERTQRLKMQAAKLKQKLRNFEPIYIPQPKDERIIQLEAELTKIKHAWALSLLRTGTSFQLSQLGVLASKKQGTSLLKPEINNKAQQLAAEVLREYLHRNPHRAKVSDFGHFPTVELKHTLQL